MFSRFDGVGPDAIWVDITPVQDAKKLERLSLDTPVVLLSKWRRIGPVILLFALVELNRGPISSARFVTVRSESCELALVEVEGRRDGQGPGSETDQVC